MQDWAVHFPETHIVITGIENTAVHQRPCCSYPRNIWNQPAINSLQYYHIRAKQNGEQTDLEVYVILLDNGRNHLLANPKHVKHCIAFVAAPV